MTKYHVSGDGIDIGVFEADSEDEAWRQAAPECDCDRDEPMPDHVTITELDYAIELLAEAEDYWADYEGECSTAHAIWGYGPGRSSPDSNFGYMDSLVWCFCAANLRDHYAQRYVLQTVDRITSAYSDRDVLSELEAVDWR